MNRFVSSKNSLQTKKIFENIFDNRNTGNKRKHDYMKVQYLCEYFVYTLFLLLLNLKNTFIFNDEKNSKKTIDEADKTSRKSTKKKISYEEIKRLNEKRSMLIKPINS